MKYLIIVATILLLGACGTMNAAIDGTQGIINGTLESVGTGLQGMAVAAGEDISGATKQK
jgi:hypothetical protein